MSNLTAVQEIYEAFGRGDVQTILAKLADDVDWEYGAGAEAAPWLERRQGRSGAAAFFASLSRLHIQRFTAKNLLEGENVVVALVDIEFVVSGTGGRVVEEDEVHIWHFDEHGKVSRFRHRVDTHQHLMAWRG